MERRRRMHEAEIITDANSKNSDSEYRVHRVGTITTGLCFVAFGILFLLHTLLGLFTYEMIMSLWPIILIALGVEVLLTNICSKRFVYDKAGVFMMVIMGFFSMGMALADICIKHAEFYM